MKTVRLHFVVLVIPRNRSEIHFMFDKNVKHKMNDNLNGSAQCVCVGSDRRILSAELLKMMTRNIPDPSSGDSCV